MRAPADSPRLFDLPEGPDFSVEERLMRRGSRFVAGADEAGRGPLAGPVVAAAVILDPLAIPAGLNDSKKLTEVAREALFPAILGSAVAVAVASASADEIDCTDIRKASLAAMCRAAQALTVAPDHLLVDGRDVPPGLSCEATALVRGDGLSLSIAAASIVAKVTRDRMMVHADACHPHYGFGRHKGYAAEHHLAAIRVHGGLIGLHRFSFSPLRQN